MYDGEVNRRGQMDGCGVIHYPDGSAQVCRFQLDEPVGEGTMWSPDRQRVWRLVAGQDALQEISLAEGKRITQRITFGSMFASPW